MADSIVETPVVPLLHHDGPTDRCATFTPEDDTPPTLVIGSGASDERITKLARKHNLDAAVLIAFARRDLAGGQHG